MELLKVVERNGARITMFAEIGQQLAHLQAAPQSLLIRGIAKQWELCVAQTVRSGHDVQLHWHPTWEESSLNESVWNLNLKQWRLADVAPEIALERLTEGRIYLAKVWRAPSVRLIDVSRFAPGHFACSRTASPFRFCAKPVCSVTVPFCRGFTTI